MHFTKRWLYWIVPLILICCFIGIWSFHSTATGDDFTVLILFIASIFYGIPLCLILLLSYSILPAFLVLFMKITPFIRWRETKFVSYLVTLPEDKAGWLNLFYQRFRQTVLKCLIIVLSLWLTLALGFGIGKMRLISDIKYAKKQAELIIQNIESYHQTKKIYPNDLKELGIPIPKLQVSWDFSYNTGLDAEGNADYFSLGFTLPHGLGVEGYVWDSRSKEWMYWKD